MTDDTEFRKHVKDALEHLYDTANLETHPLLSHFPNEAADTRLTRAQRLRSLLKDTIESLRPPEGTAPGTPEWRSYLALRHRYVQGMSLGEAEMELGISLRQLQRELHKGLDAVTALLWEKRRPAAIPGDEEKPELENELDRWEISRENCDVLSLIGDTLWMLKPQMDERGVTVPGNLPAPSRPVFVDATLTRQVMYHLLSAIVRSTPPGPLALNAREEDQQLVLVASPAHSTVEAEEDWQIARLICQRQGLGLEIRAQARGGNVILLSLPFAAQRSILVIDDNAAIHQLFERYLTPHHYHVIHANSGQNAFQLAVESHPDAITLDVMMPNVDGWQVLRRLSEDSATARIPVIICSVLKEPALAFSLGAQAYLKKPVDRLELVATLERLLPPANPSAAGPQSESADS